MDIAIDEQLLRSSESILKDPVGHALPFESKSQLITNLKEATRGKFICNFCKSYIFSYKIFSDP